MFCWCGRGETKISGSTKRHQNRQPQKLFWAVGKCYDRCTASSGEYSEGDWNFSLPFVWGGGRWCAGGGRMVGGKGD